MDITLAVWILPVALFVLTILLLLYLAILNWAPVRKEAAPASPPRQAVSSSVQNPVVLNPPPPPAPAPPQYQMPVQQQYYAPPPSSVPMAAPMRAHDATEVDTMGKMVILTGLEPREIPLPSAQFNIGRFYSPENNVLVSIDEKSVSRRHAAMRIAVHGREYYLQDVGSSYGTHLFIEGRVERLTPGHEARVYNHDIVQFGSAVQVRFILPCETRSAVTQL